MDVGADSDTGVGCKGGNYPAWLKLGDGPKGYYFEFIVENLILALVREGDIC